MDERRPIPGYPGFYATIGGSIIGQKGQPLCECLDRWKYRRVCVSVCGKRKVLRVHSLVMLAFVGPRPEGKEVNHKDGNKGNNSLDNLEYVTKSENVRHSFAVLGRPPPYRKFGADHCNAICVDRELLLARRAAGATWKELVIEFGGSIKTLGNIVGRRHWSTREPSV